MKIFTDMHNGGLAYAQYLLLEKRLGHELFFPIGMEWADEYWKIHAPYNFNEGTAKQYLQIKTEHILKDNYYEVEDIGHNYIRKHITLEQFKNMDIDVVIASVPEHIESFKKLAQMKGAKFILHVGNIWWDKSVDFSQIPNLMSATIEYNVPASTNVVWYHEEFDDFFRPSDLIIRKQIVSFINCLSETGHAPLYYMMNSEMPDFEFRSYGGSCDNGVIDYNWEIAQIMQESFFGFHAKKFGDGYGLIFHQWFACGRPIITSFSDYADKLGGKLLIDGETAIDSDNHTVYDMANLLRNMTPDKYQFMCQRSYEVFKENVDFEADAEKVKNFLERLNA